MLDNENTFMKNKYVFTNNRMKSVTLKTVEEKAGQCGHARQSFFLSISQN